MDKSTKSSSSKGVKGVERAGKASGAPPSSSNSSGPTTRAQGKAQTTLTGSGEAKFPAPSSLATPATPDTPIRIFSKPPGPTVSKNRSVESTPVAVGRGGEIPVVTGQDSEAESAGSLPALRAVTPSDTTATSATSVDGTQAPRSATSAPQESASRSFYVGTLLRAAATRSATGPPDSAPVDAARREAMDQIRAATAERSETPSLASLVNPPQSEAHSVTRLSAEEYESITSALIANRGQTRIFITNARALEIYDEDLSSSLLRYHPAFDPLTDDDPLLPFGARDGVLPFKTVEESMLLRDVVMRWTQPHRLWNWDTLEEGVREYSHVRVTQHDLVGFHASADSDDKIYMLGAFHLERLAQLTLAVHQILSGLQEFLDTPARKRFYIDPNWQFLRLMEENISRSAILMLFSSLQYRLAQAVKHIKRHFNSIKRVYNQELDVVSTVDSTLSSVRSAFGRDPPEVELGKMLARPDYGSRAYDSLARDQYVEKYTADGRQAFYKDREVERAAARALPPSPDPEPQEQGNVQEEGAPPGLGSVPERSAHFLSMPPSISAVGQGPVSYLPGMGSLPRWPETSVPAKNSAFAPGTNIADVEKTRSVFSASVAPSANAAAAPASQPPNVSAAATGMANHWTSYNFRHSTLANPAPSGQGTASQGGGVPPSGGGLPPAGGPPNSGQQLPGFPGAPGGGGVPPQGGPPSGGYPSGGNGGGAAPPPGGDGAPPPGGGAPYEYRHPDWQMNCKLDMRQIPEWDGHGKTVMEYLGRVAELIRLSPQMVVDLGAVAPLKFTDRAEKWWRGTPVRTRNYLAQSWSFLLRGIQSHFLNANWLQSRRREWEEQRFRQRGYENELPVDFLQRRNEYHVYLHPHEEDGVDVVDCLLATAPDVWDGVINSERYPSVFTLMAAVQRYSKTLMGHWLTAQRLGNLNGYYPRRSDRKANAADAHGFESDSDSDEGPAVGPTAPAASSGNSSKAAYAANGFNKSRGRQNQADRPKASSSRMNWPEGKTVKGYNFSKRDDVHSDRPPANGVCYVCSSARHFARDCPHYGKWLSMRDANMLETEVSYEVEEADYTEYIAMVAEAVNANASAYSSETSETGGNSETDSNSGTDIPVVDAKTTGAMAAHLPTHYGRNRNIRRRESFERRNAAKGKVKEVNLSEVKIPRKIARFKDSKATESPTESPEERRPLEPEAKSEVPLPEHKRLTGTTSSSLGEHKRVEKALKARSLPPGFASLGVRALHIKVAVGSPDALPVKGRLDSGADITLISEEYYNSIPNLPKPREGLRMRLYALTGEAKVLGYTRFPMFALASDGVLISFEVEAYVVRNMRVPLLLGEDFQVSYELGVTRYTSGHCDVRVGRSERIIPGSSAQGVDLGFDLRRVLAVKTQPFLRRSAAIRERTRAARMGNKGPPEVLAAEDVLINAGSVHNVRVKGPFAGREEWIVEKVIISTDDESVLTAPTTWINTATPMIPIANPSPRPWYIRKGEVVGHLRDPSSFADKPKDDEEKEKFTNAADAMRATIGTLRAQDLANAGDRMPTGDDDKLDGDEAWGPKTTAVPEDPLPDVDVSTLVDQW